MSYFSKVKVLIIFLIVIVVFLPIIFFLFTQIWHANVRKLVFSKEDSKP